ncbi:hypothetical protein B0H17DRAFT_1338137 [Mycena rosella]|uniref:RING-type domain-containing protein n=1 Tax=Mycena rosella TaxID=1033263 RepID=A0AAD7G4Q6_MYCRO|nr:hypothetical protein B0H17DRAFT_1338137 [Mycena rosella]
MGSGALGLRDTKYQPGSTWLGKECLDDGSAKEFRHDTTTPFGRAFHKREASYFVLPYPVILGVNIFITTLSAAYWSVSAVAAAQVLRHIDLHNSKKVVHIYHPSFFRPGTIYGLVSMCFVAVLTIQGVLALVWAVGVKWLFIGRRRDGPCAWDKSSYCQRWQLQLVLSRPAYQGFANGGGQDWAELRHISGREDGSDDGARPGKARDNVSIDDCSVVAHINSRGNFALNSLQIAARCDPDPAFFSASMEDSSMLLEHTLLTSGDVADCGTVYFGWPAQAFQGHWEEKHPHSADNSLSLRLLCPMCTRFPQHMTVTVCGHVFCEMCIHDWVAQHGKCPVCTNETSSQNLIKIYPSFSV